VSNRRTPTWVLVLAAALCLAGAVALQVARERWLPPATLASQQTLYLRSGETLSRLALSYDTLLADVYWIRAIQYFGRTRLSDDVDKDYDLLFPLLDITTTLDPYFNIAYRFGAVFLAEGYPDGPGQPLQAIALLKKGFAARPTKWQYLHDIGFVYYWTLGDYTESARWFRKAADVPGSPEWLSGLAAATLARGGDRAQSRFLWEQIYAGAEHEYMRRTARFRLEQLAVMDELDALSTLLARIEQETGTRPHTWRALAARGWIHQDPPLDPGGAPYAIDAQTGRAVLSETSLYAPLPVEPPAEPQPSRGGPS
jgi:tetratricopeptide (TPR) repeat protein